MKLKLLAASLVLAFIPACSRPSDVVGGAPWDCGFEDQPDAPIASIRVTLAHNGGMTTIAQGRIRDSVGRLHEPQVEIEGTWRVTEAKFQLDIRRAQFVSIAINGKPAPEEELRRANQEAKAMVETYTPGDLEILEMSSRALRLKGPLGVIGCNRP